MDYSPGLITHRPSILGIKKNFENFELHWPNIYVNCNCSSKTKNSKPAQVFRTCGLRPWPFCSPPVNITDKKLARKTIPISEHKNEGTLKKKFLERIRNKHQLATFLFGLFSTSIVRPPLLGGFSTSILRPPLFWSAERFYCISVPISNSILLYKLTRGSVEWMLNCRNSF